jgi:hypothetical protein
VVIEQRVDAQRHRATGNLHRRPVADIGVPERIDAVGLSAQPHMPVRGAQAGAVDPVQHRATRRTARTPAAG